MHLRERQYHLREDLRADPSNARYLEVFQPAECGWTLVKSVLVAFPMGAAVQYLRHVHLYPNSLQRKRLSYTAVGYIFRYGAAGMYRQR